MILINLLPHREEKRKRRKQAFFAGMGLAALVGAGIVAAVSGEDPFAATTVMRRHWS